MICSTATDIYTISTYKQTKIVLIAPHSLSLHFSYQKIVVTFFLRSWIWGFPRCVFMLSICFLLFHVFFFYCKISKPLKFMASHSFYYYFFFSERARECDDSFNKIKSLTDTHWAINGLLFMCDSYCIWSYLSFQRKSIHLSAKTWVTSQLNKQRDTNCLLRHIRMLLCGCILRKKNV